MFQHFNLFRNKNVLQNMIYAPMKVRGLPEAQAVEKAMRLLDRVGLADKARSLFRAFVDGPLNCVDLSTRPYPGFPTDMQAQIMALMCCSRRAGVVTEGIFENRFMHVQELCRLGAHITFSGQSAMIQAAGSPSPGRP